MERQLGRRCCSISVASSVGGPRSLRGACREITPSQNTDICLVRKKNPHRRERIFQGAIPISSRAARAAVDVAQPLPAASENLRDFGRMAVAGDRTLHPAMIAVRTRFSETEHANVKMPHHAPWPHTVSQETVARLESRACGVSKLEVPK